VDLDLYYICGIIIALSSHNCSRKTQTGLNCHRWVQGLDAHTLWTGDCTVAGLRASVKSTCTVQVVVNRAENTNPVASC